jgi:hypothetical protein
LYYNTKMDKSAQTYCVMIASHISNPKRVAYLIECLGSLIAQTITIPVYLSISFENEAIKGELERELESNGLRSHPTLFFLFQEEKTPQMRHFQVLSNIVEQQWIMFCDDDDTYDSTRVENLINSINNIQSQINNQPKICAGLYESHCNKDHREHRHEYWCYCVNKCILDRFYGALIDYPDIIDNKCCDVLFGEYMRRLGPQYIFGRLDMRLYNYRVTENQDSITGVIQASQRVYTKSTPPPPTGDPLWADYIIDWNDYLYQHLEVYLHDVFLRTIVGCPLDNILQSEFRMDYVLLPFVDDCHVAKIKQTHEYLRSVCSKLYDISL